MSQNWTPPPPPNSAPANIPNYLVFAILTTVFCCLPAGVVSIVYAAQVNGKIQAGDIAGAMAASKNAKLWAMISAGVGIAGIAIYIIFMVILGGLGAMSGTR
ncbi:MAG: CD225/dispanin family protein [Pyrinomonadaceae bacterium]